MAKTILLTGCAGFIGYHSARTLLERGDRIIGIDNLNNYYDPKLKEARLEILKKYPGFKFLKQNIEDDINIKEKIDIICHLAAQAGVRYSIENPFAYEKTNMLGTLNILEFARNSGIKSIVFASSSSVYGNAKEVPFKETMKLDEPISLYAATKKANELYCHVYFHLFGINMIGLRFFTVYGTWGRPDMALFKFTESILAGKEIEVFNNGNLVRDFTYVDDIVDGVIKSIDKLLENDISNVMSDDSKKSEGERSIVNSKKGNISNVNGEKSIQSSKRNEESNNNTNNKKIFEIINLGRGQPIQLMDFIHEIENATGKTAKLKMLGMQAGDVNQTFADISKAKALLGYNPKTSVHDGIAKFVDWYKGYYKVK